MSLRCKFSSNRITRRSQTFFFFFFFFMTICYIITSEGNNELVHYRIRLGRWKALVLLLLFCSNKAGISSSTSSQSVVCLLWILPQMVSFSLCKEILVDKLKSYGSMWWLVLLLNLQNERKSRTFQGKDFCDWDWVKFHSSNWSSRYDDFVVTFVLIFMPIWNLFQKSPRLLEDIWSYFLYIPIWLVYTPHSLSQKKESYSKTCGMDINSITMIWF